MFAKVANKYQLTIPKRLRASLTIAPGDTLHGSFSDGALRLSSRPREGHDEPEVEVKVWTRLIARVQDLVPSPLDEFARGRLRRKRK